MTRPVHHSFNTRLKKHVIIIAHSIAHWHWLKKLGTSWSEWVHKCVVKNTQATSPTKFLYATQLKEGYIATPPERLTGSLSAQLKIAWNVEEWKSHHGNLQKLNPLYCHHHGFGGIGQEPIFHVVLSSYKLDTGSSIPTLEFFVPKESLQSFWCGLHWLTPRQLSSTLET